MTPRLAIVDTNGLRSETEASPVLSVLVSLQRAGVAHRHDCGGKTLCGSCRVRVLAGRLSPPGERERERLLALGEPVDGSVRLACQARPAGPVELEAMLPPKA